MSEPLKCCHLLEDGKQCGAYALAEKDLCFSHDPQSKQAKLEAVTKGGRAKGVTVPEALTPVEVKVPQDVTVLLAQTVIALWCGKISEKKASSTGFLAGLLLKSFEVSRNAKQMDAMESAFGIIPPKHMMGR